MSDESDFAGGKFKAECGQMLLTKAGDNPLVIAGPGEIWQDEEGRLQFKIFATQRDYLKLTQYSWRDVKPGEIIPDEDYFSLEVASHSGPCWSWQRVLPTVSGGLAEGMARGSLPGLFKEEPIPSDSETASVRLCFRGKQDFPCNRGTSVETKVGDKVRRRSSALNVAFVDDEELHFEFYHEGGYTVALLNLPLGQYHEATPDRIHEALQFVLGRQLALMTIETRLGKAGTTRLVSPDRGAGRLPPPLRFQTLDAGGHVWRMFTRYFRHIMPRAAPGWHPMSRQIAGVVESSAASFEAQMLALGVATEGLAGECFPTLAPVDAEFLAEVARVIVLIEQEAAAARLSRRMADRLKGAADGMREVRKSDILRAFIKRHQLPGGLYKSWSKVRNTTAHGNGGGGRPIEEALKLYHETLSLFYALVLESIGYAGPRTNYAASSWPNAEWPVSAEPSTPST